jgi:hypothetical protein
MYTRWRIFVVIDYGYDDVSFLPDSSAVKAQILAAAHILNLIFKRITTLSSFHHPKNSNHWAWRTIQRNCVNTSDKHEISTLCALRGNFNMSRSSQSKLFDVNGLPLDTTGLHLSENSGVRLFRMTCWSRRLLWSYSQSTSDDFKSQLQLAIRLFSMWQSNQRPLKDYK